MTTAFVFVSRDDESPEVMMYWDIPLGTGLSRKARGVTQEQN